MMKDIHSLPVVLINGCLLASTLVSVVNVVGELLFTRWKIISAELSLIPEKNKLEWIHGANFAITG